MSLAKAFLTVGGLTMGSRVLGLAREIMIAAFLGAGPVAEAFFVAFRFPNLFRRFFAEGAFNMAFVPLFAKRLEGRGPDEGPEGARAFAEQAQAGMLSVLVPFVVLVQVAMPWAILGIAYGFTDDPAKLDLARALAVIQFPYLLFVSLAALYSGVLNSLGRFAAAAGAPILLNVFMILGMLVSTQLLGADASSEELQRTIGFSLAWAVFFAGLAQLGMVIKASSRAGMPLRLRRPRWTPGMKRLLYLGAPGAIAGGVTQINILIGTTIATFFDGAVAWLAYADRLYQLPLGVIGVAIGVALLPELSRRLRAGDPDGASKAATNAVEIALAFAVPSAVALVVMPETIVQMLFGRGAFTDSDVRQTGIATAIFALGLPAYVLNKCLSPAYFADEDTRTPLRFAMWSMAFNTIFSAAMASVIGWVAVPIGTAIAAWINIALLWNGLKGRAARPNTERLRSRIIGIGLASIALGAALLAAVDYAQAWIADPRLIVPVVLAICLLGAVFYFAVAFLTGGFSRRDLGALRRSARDGDATAT